MSYTSHDLLDAACRAIPEVSVEAVAARRTRGDEVVLLDVREKDEVRTGYIGVVTTLLSPDSTSYHNSLIHV
jgi:rhodanese-related sulfurtransferase